MIGENACGDVKPCSSPERADAQSVGSDVDQDRADVDAGDQPALHGGPHGDCQVRLDLAVDRAPQALLEQAVNQRSASGPADQHDLVDLVRLKHGVGERVVQAGQGLEQQRLGSALRTRAG